jgi:hypothetical protein
MSFHLGYIDPGSGSVIWQAAMGGVLGGAYMLRNGVARLFNRGGKSVGASTKVESPSDSGSKAN